MHIKVQSAGTRFLAALFSIVLVTILSRAPFLYPACPGSDESTLILMGQSIVDGYLPYVHLWDNKPPLAFALFALPVSLFGKSIVGVRIFAMLCVAITALLAYFIGHRIRGYRAGILSAILVILAIGGIEAGQLLMTEHLAVVPLVGALCLAISKRMTAANFWWVGILLALASLIRLNLAYAALLVGLVLLLLPPRPRGRDFLIKGTAYACGGLTVVLLTYLPYLVAGESETWWRSVFMAPWAYSSSRLTLLEAAARQVYWGFGLADGITLSNSFFWMALLLWGGGAVGICLELRDRFNSNTRYVRDIFLVLVFLCSTGLSIVMSGAADTHYLIQVIPFFAIGLALAADRLLNNYRHILVLAALAFWLTLAFRPVPQALYRLADTIFAGQTLPGEVGYRIAKYINQSNPRQKPVYFLNDQIGYWYTDQSPPHKMVTHPSNISKDYLLRAVIGPGASPEGLMAEIMERELEFIVSQNPDRLWYLKDTAAGLVLKRALAERYRVVQEIGGRKIYRLSPNNPED